MKQIDTDSQLFYPWFIEKRKDRDLENQENTILAAKSIKDNLQNLAKVPKKHKWLLEKIQKQLIERGCVRKSTLESICDEIIDPKNSSSLRHWSKSSMKQSVESFTKEFLSLRGINLLSGKLHGLTPRGPKSIRMSKEGQLVFGGKMIRALYHKSFDSKLDENNLVFQKVSTDNGGNTDSVYTEVQHTIESCVRFIQKNKGSEKKFWFLLDGPFWGRKDHQEDIRTRYETLKQFEITGLIVTNSDEIQGHLLS